MRPTAVEQEYRQQMTVGTNNSDGRLQELCEIIDIKKWEMNGAAVRYIRSHEAVQHISIRDRLDEFMQQHGDTLASILAPELMAVAGQTGTVKDRSVDRSVIYLREALSLWLAGVKNRAVKYMYLTAQFLISDTSRCFWVSIYNYDF